MEKSLEAELRDLAKSVLERCRQRHWKMAVAESCTGGLICSILTSIPGSSDVLDCGFITYSNKAKRDLLDIPLSLIETHGAVSESIVRAMALGAMRMADAHLAIACTGIAGPSGGSSEKPIGRVHIAATCGQGVQHKQMDYGNIGRDQVRAATVRDALILAEEVLDMSCGIPR